MDSEKVKRSSGKLGEVRGTHRERRALCSREALKKHRAYFGKPRILQGPASCYREKSPPVRDELDKLRFRRVMGDYVALKTALQGDVPHTEWGIWILWVSLRKRRF